MGQNCIAFALSLLGFKPQDDISEGELNAKFRSTAYKPDVLAIIHEETGTVAHMAVYVGKRKLRERPGIDIAPRIVTEKRIVGEYKQITGELPNNHFRLFKGRRK